MKPGSVVEVYITKFSHGFFVAENLGTFAIAVNPVHYWVKNFSLKYFYLGFILFLNFQYLDSYYNEYHVKQRI